MRDPDHWKAPEEFNPDRFIAIDEEGVPMLTKKEERVVSFGIGNKFSHKYLLNSRFKYQ